MSFLARLLASWSAPPHQASSPSVPAVPTPPTKPVLVPAPLKRRPTDADFAAAAGSLGVDVAAMKAIAEVEAAGEGFDADGRPKVLYEAHVFDELTGGRFRGAKDRRGVALSVEDWDRSLYGKSGAWQHERLEDAMRLDREAALRACSWGTFQVLGRNHAMVGFPTIDGFVEAMRRGADGHLQAFVGFLKATNLSGPIRAGDWRTVARRYNGPAYEKGGYHTKLAAAFAKHSAKR